MKMELVLPYHQAQSVHRISHVQEVRAPVGCEHMNLNELSDEQLMHSVKKGEMPAFRFLYERHGAKIKGFCARIMRDEALAEEVTQETFWRVWRNAGSFNNRRGSVQTWMFGIARNLSIDVLRRQKAHLEPLHGETTEDEGRGHQLASHHDVTEAAWTSLQEQQVHLALAALPEEQREVINWIYFQGKTRREIAREKDIPFGTINTRARLALDKLRRALHAQGYGLEEL